LDNAESVEGEPRVPRSSLRSELLFNLSFLAAAALSLALWTASVLPVSFSTIDRSQGLFIVLVVVDILIFVVLGNHLVKRLVLRPLNETVAVAEAIAHGDYERRVPEGRTREMAGLSRSLNRLTDELLHNQERLAENVRSLDETNRILNETQRELIQVEKMASIGRLAAGIAHEIGNPLGALIGYASVLRRRGAEVTLLDGIEREARRIDQIVRGLLDYARPGNAPREIVDVNASLRRVLVLLQKQGRLAAVELNLDLQTELPGIAANQHRLDQVFLNLFSNADAAMEGEGRLTVHTRAEIYHPDRPLPVRRADDPPGIDYSHLRRLRHGAIHDPRSLEADMPVVRVVIADSGPGISKENLDAVFDPFFTTKPPGEGTGLGLAIVAGTVAELGGRIELTSVPGGGATFHLFFPIPLETP
jgi:two-component system NtrC family sensor kinase